MAVEAGTVLDLKPLHRHVAAELGVLAQSELVARGQHALDVTFDGHVRPFDESLHGRAVADLEVARDPKLALGLSLDGHVPVVVELAIEAVARAQRDLVGSVAA